jgi:hypothetical protein
MDPPPLSHFLPPIFPSRPSYPQPKSKTYPQLAVHNFKLLRLVFFFLCITWTRLYIMDVVGTGNGKTLGFLTF